MRVRVNGEDREVPADTTVAGLVADVAGVDGRVAVAVNGEVVRRDQWDQVEVGSDDRVEIVAAIQGGR
jgi:sulfur carrier protein